MRSSERSEEGRQKKHSSGRKRRDSSSNQENVFLSGLDPRNTTKANKFKLKKQSQAPIDRVIPTASSSSRRLFPITLASGMNMCSRVNFTFY